MQYCTTANTLEFTLNVFFAQIADNELNRSMQEPQFVQAAQFKALSNTQASGNVANMKR